MRAPAAAAAAPATAARSRRTAGKGSVPVVPQPGEAPSPSRGGGEDWTVQAADTIERVVVGIRDKTAVPLTTVARALVYGLLAAVMGLSVLVLVVIGLTRALNAHITQGEVWASYLLVGGIFTLVGAFTLRKATSDKAARGKGDG
ncbi:MAG: hypothetical protein ACRD0S_03465, partial [Acidimicrobiales bacterium]